MNMQVFGFYDECIWRYVDNASTPLTYSSVVMLDTVNASHF